MISRDLALKTVSTICDEQKTKHGDDNHDVPEWLIIARRQLQKAEQAWYRGYKTEALFRMGHVAACGVTALEQNGREPHAADAEVAICKPNREKQLEELLRSACCIAEREGQNTAWARFAKSIYDLGLNGITARPYLIPKF